MLQAGGVTRRSARCEALRLSAALYDDPLDPAALLDRVGLRRPGAADLAQLSGGEQQRLSLALALVGRPEVAFLDEPTSGVDLAGRQVIREVVAELRDDGVTVLLTTHDLDEAERLADRVVIVDHGRLVADGHGRRADRARPRATTRCASGAPAGLDRDSLARAPRRRGGQRDRPGRVRRRRARPTPAPSPPSPPGWPSTTCRSPTCAPAASASRTSSSASPASPRTSG